MDLFNKIAKVMDEWTGYSQSAAAADQPPVAQANHLAPIHEPSNISATSVASDIQNAIRQAENGDPRELFRFYRDSLMGDEHIQGEVGKRKLAVLGQPLTILPADKNSQDDIIAAAACMQAMEDCEKWNEGISALLDSAALWPVAANELIFRSAEKPLTVTLPGEDNAAEPGSLSVPLQFTFKRWAPVNPMLFCFKWAYYGGGGDGSATMIQNLNPQAAGTSPYNIDLERWEPMLKLWPTTDTGRINYDAANATYLDPNRHVVHRGHLLTQMKDNWGGPGRAILFWWWLRGTGRDGFARFMERYGSPFPVGKTNTQDPQSVALLQKAFSQAAKIWGLVISQDDSVELTQASVQGGADGHKTWHEVCNDAISFHITGYKSSQKPTGLNSGESQTIENVREDVRIFDQKTLAATLRKQVFERLLKFNGLIGSIKVIWGGLSDEDAATFAGLLKTMGEAGYEPTDNALEIVNEKTGLEWQRKAAPVMTPGMSGDPALADQTPATLSAGSLLRRNNAAAVDPMDAIVARQLTALTAAYKGSMAPFRRVVMESNSREECLAKLKTLYADWQPGRLETELNTALQLAAAAGAASAKTK